MGKPWFRVKRYGYGAGLPISWEGWAVMTGYLAFILTVSALGASFSVIHPLAYASAIIAPTLALVVVAWRKSDRPWKWRNGGE